MTDAPPLERVRAILRAAARIASRADPLGAEARRVLPGTTGLSPEGVELALREHLETDPDEASLERLVAGVSPAPRAHVILSGTVFTGALRALALALAASPDVSVRPSRREPEMVRLLHAASGGGFRVVPELEPSPGDVVWVYGKDETVEAVLRGMPAAVSVLGHGSGFGVVLLSADVPDDSLARDAEGVARDVVPFDQRGCLSPRIVLVQGSERSARRFAERLAASLAEWEERVPRGTLDDTERADAVRYRDTMLYSGELIPAGSGLVGVDVSGGVVLPPTGRHVHVARPTDLAATAFTLARFVVAWAVSGPEPLRELAAAVFPEARGSALGSMQRPPLDGPVDGRTRFLRSARSG
ncbi:MAG TPA: acyl-CoA reductase [Polyangiaceae bacterium]|nr:acyl-CoA reductase [Polyangiaceae bacterium]